ncbi:polysaccharide deacetylase family protein [Streptosporangium sp. DT93]|uniref:polysaccharide deacetylase family protein n=1 Tax=Streptosporangium sp. DT93 TaxID=3393428 RepID=UPI003CF7490A
MIDHFPAPGGFRKRRTGIRNALVTGLAGILGAAFAVPLSAPADATVTLGAAGKDRHIGTDVTTGRVGDPSSASDARAAGPGDCTAGYVGLTFDDGPNPGTTTALLNALTANGVRATMFNVGQNAQNNASLVRAQQDAGMWIGNHSWTHPHLTRMSVPQIQSELQRTQQALQQVTGTAPRLFRPPYGETDATVRSVEQQLGLTEVLWDVDSQDWNGASTAQIVQAARTLQNGQIILMHDTYATTIAAIPQIAADLRSRNLCAGMISPSTGRAVAPGGGTGPTPTPTPTPTVTPPGGCTATISPGQQWGDRFNLSVTVSGSSAWVVTVTVRSPQRVIATWNGTPSWDASGNVMTMRPNGNGNTFGFTIQHGGNRTWPSVSCRVA